MRLSVRLFRVPSGDRGHGQLPGPQDAAIRAITTKGVLWDLRPAQGPAIFRAVGTLVESYDEGPVFSGQVTINGESSRYGDVPLETFLTDEFFVTAECEATTS